MKYLLLAPLALFLTGCEPEAPLNISCTEGGVSVLKYEGVYVWNMGDGDYRLYTDASQNTFLTDIRNGHCIVTPYSPSPERK